MKANLKNDQSRKKRGWNLKGNIAREAGIAPIEENGGLQWVQDEEQLKFFLNEFLMLEDAFTRSTQVITSIFEMLQQIYPQEHIFEKYHHSLTSALPYLEKIRIQSQLLARDFTLNIQDKIRRVVALYSGESYYQLLFNFTFLYSEFEQWGGEVEYQRLIVNTRSLSRDILNAVDSIDSPLIFIERLSQLKMLTEELSKYTSDPEVQTMVNVIQGFLHEVSTKKCKIEALANISYLLIPKNGEVSKEDQKQAVQLFIEHRLFIESEYHEIGKAIKKKYPLFFQDILQNLFKHIEELKIKTKTRSSKQLEKIKDEFKAKLLIYLEYSRKEYGDSLGGFEAWSHLADAVLAEASLNHSLLKSYLEKFPENQKLSLMKCIADLFIL